MARAFSWSWICCSCFAWQVASQDYPFCVNGREMPDVFDDKGVPSVDVILVQAPLFSTNPSIGQKLGAFGLYHTGIVLSQEYIDCKFASGCHSMRRNWTLEFDYMGGNVLSTLYPKIVGNEMHWDNDVGFCLSDGILWGQSHWTKSFDTVARITAAQVKTVFKDVVHPLNSSTAVRPQYQLWRVVKGGWFGRAPRETFVKDITCLDGARWIFYHIFSVLDVQQNADFELRGTAALVDADHIEPVNTSDPAEWSSLIKYYTHLSELTTNASTVEKIWDVIQLVPAKYVYDTNARVYHRVVGNHFPWARPRFIVDPLAPSPTAANLPAMATSAQIVV